MSSRAEVLSTVVRRTGASRARLEGVADWLSRSRVAFFDGEDQRICLHPETNPYDLALRFGAWVGSQRVERDHVELLTAYSRAVASACAHAQSAVGAGDEGWCPLERSVDAPSSPSDQLTTRIHALLDMLDRTLVERRAHTRAVLLAIVSGHHALLLGPPGTAKSMLARAVQACFEDASYFEYLLSRFTHPDELFGPISIPGLKDEDYRRLTEGFLPTAHVAFLDEIFKANSAILNSLLTVINERVFHHGRHRDEVPLIGLVGASNELPDPEGGLGALYDRFLVRLAVPPIGDTSSFLAVATGQVPELKTEPRHRLSVAELADIRRRAGEVQVPAPVRAALVALWRKSADLAWGMSDRRWRHAVFMLKVAAVTEGRDALEVLDLLLLEWVLTPDPSRRHEVHEALVDVVSPRAVPEHDLLAQWTLLHLDRVAPAPSATDDALWDGEASTLEAVTARRRLQAQRMILHTEAATARLASRRDVMEQSRQGRLWLPRLPPRVLTAYIESGREVAGILAAAERYVEMLSTAERAASALVAELPKPTRRDFGPGVVLRLRIHGSEVEVGLTMAGERVTHQERRASEPTAPQVPSRGGRLSRQGIRAAAFDEQMYAQAPVLGCTAQEFLAMLRGELSPDVLLGRIPLGARARAGSALSRVMYRLGSLGVPKPPPLEPA